MRLDEYQWSRNPRGMHNQAASVRMNVDKLNQQHMGWAKIVTLGADYMDVVDGLLKQNITPIVRIFRPNYGAAPAAPDMLDAYRAYVRAGVKWFEFYNEPNLGNEWPNGVRATYLDVPNIIAPLLTNWLTWAEFIISLGAYPAFPALAEATGPDVEVTQWLKVMMTYLAENALDRFRAVAGSGLWCATHPYVYNHWYQERGGPTSARSAGEMRAAEGGWHFEYPYDPVTQADKPGLTAISGPAGQPLGDPIGLIGMGMGFHKYFQALLGGGSIPVIGTEGGIYPVPKGTGDFKQLDSRFPGYDYTSHGEATVAMFNWISSPAAPAWMFGVTLWKEDDYYGVNGYDVPAVGLMSQYPPVSKTVPPIESLGDVYVKGPSPIHGSPDYHFVLLAPGFNADWFFDAARPYYERFRPSVLNAADFIGNIDQKSIGITVLTLPETADYIADLIRGQWPNVYVDMVAVRSGEELAAALNERVTNGRRFG